MLQTAHVRKLKEKKKRRRYKIKQNKKQNRQDINESAVTTGYTRAIPQANRKPFNNSTTCES